MNFALYVLLESIDLTLLKLTRWAQKAIRNLEYQLGMAMQTRQATGKQSRQQHRQAIKQAVQIKQHKGCYNEDQVGVVEQLYKEDQAAPQGGQVAILDCR